MRDLYATIVLIILVVSVVYGYKQTLLFESLAAGARHQDVSYRQGGAL